MTQLHGDLGASSFDAVLDELRRLQGDDAAARYERLLETTPASRRILFDLVIQQSRTNIALASAIVSVATGDDPSHRLVREALEQILDQGSMMREIVARLSSEPEADAA